MSPYFQGSLDNFCGIYSIINAINILCGPLNNYQARQLFKRILICINSRENNVAIGQGLTINDVARVINEVVCSEYAIRRYKPFHGQGDVRFNDYWHTLQAELELPNTIAFIGISGRFAHWSIVQRVTDHNLILNDSINIRYLNRKQCIMASHRARERRRYWLYPHKTYILKLR